MTLPRQVVPGRDYMITRRCSERRFFLRPDDDTNNAFIYCLVLAATRAKVQVTVFGRARILQQNPFHCPESHAPRFQMSPRVAAQNKWTRIEALQRNRGFIEKYREAFRGHMAGLANVLFPFGTFWMRKFAKVACEAAETIEKAVAGSTVTPASA